MKKYINIILVISTIFTMNVASAKDFFYPYTLYPSNESLNAVREKLLDEKKDPTSIDFQPATLTNLPVLRIEKDGEVSKYQVFDSIGAAVIAPLVYHYAVNCYINASMLTFAEYYEKQEKKKVTSNAPSSFGPTRLLDSLFAPVQDEYFLGSDMKRFTLDPFCTTPLDLSTGAFQYGDLDVPFSPGIASFFAKAPINAHIIENVSHLYSADPLKKSTLEQELEKSVTSYKNMAKNIQGDITSQSQNISSASKYVRSMVEAEYQSYMEFLYQYDQNAPTVSADTFELSAWYGSAFKGNTLSQDGSTLPSHIVLSDQRGRQYQVPEFTTISNELRKARMAKDITLIVFQDYLTMYPVHLAMKKLAGEFTILEGHIDAITQIILTLQHKFPATIDPFTKK